MWPDCRPEIRITLFGDAPGLLASDFWSIINWLSAAFHTMKNVAYFLFWVGLSLPLVIGLQNCKKDDPATPANPGGPGSTTTTPGTSTTSVVSTVPLISTTVAPTVSAMGSTSATVSAIINSNGGATLTQHGFVWSKTAQLPTVTDAKIELGTTNGPFPLTINSNLTGLEANTTYFVRSYATNSVGTAYGAVGQVKTDQLPVTTNPDDAETIYVGANYTTYSIDAATGKLNRQYSITGGGAYADPTLDNNVLYTGYSTLFAFNATTGSRQWELTTLNGTFTTPITVGGGALYGVFGDKLVAYDATTRAKKWEVAAQNGTSPVLFNGVLYEASSNGLVALNATDGTRKWLYSSGTAMYTGVAILGGIAYATGQRNTLHAVDIATGTKKWTYEMGTTFDVLSSCATVVNNTVYAGSGDKKLYAVDATTGAKKWDFLTGGTVASSPFVANGLVFFFSSDANIYAVDAATGTKKWNVSVGNPPALSSPVVVNGVVYIAGGNKTLYAFDAVTGTEKWRVTTTENLTSSPTVVAKNGKVFHSGRSGAQQ